MLGRVTMAFGHRALHCVQHTLCYLPEPFGVAWAGSYSVTSTSWFPRVSVVNNLPICNQYYLLSRRTAREHRPYTTWPFTRHAASLHCAL